MLCTIMIESAMFVLLQGVIDGVNLFIKLEKHLEEGHLIRDLMQSDWMTWPLPCPPLLDPHMPQHMYDKLSYISSFLF